MILDTDRLIKQFYEKIRNDYPDLSFEKIEKICKLPFHYFRSLIENGDFPKIHIKYFGKFLVYKRNVTNILNSLTKRKEKGLMSQEEFEESTCKLVEYLNKENYELPKTDN